MPEPDPNVRLSNAEREALIARLQTATEEGRLDLHEFAERSREVYEARTYADVERLLTDLPAEDRALAVPRAPAASGDMVLEPSYTHLKRQGAWIVPGLIRVNPKYSRVTLDFRTAEFTTREVEIAVNLEYAGLKVILPKGAHAIDDGVILEGGQVINRAFTPGGGQRIRLTGRVLYSRLKVRYERRFLWWRW
ncbi:DUF1707 domain-containing protein [Glycomyces sp. NPDC047010]|uniref:DUF1707 SHOCT-like domain-containing protein n=1 Tax=Glycomyces sp. NPDC047010 TaxID=3155023 RepID=UPI0033C19851